MLDPFPCDVEHLHCCLIKMIKMADLIPFLENPYLKFGLPKNYEKIAQNVQQAMIYKFMSF